MLFSETRELSGDLLIGIWMEYMKTLCFEHFLHAKYTESISDRSVDIECFEGDTFTFFGIWVSTESLHVMQTISEFYDDDAEVLDHRDEHLTETLYRALLTSVLDGGEFRESLTDRCDLITEFF